MNTAEQRAKWREEYRRRKIRQGRITDGASGRSTGIRAKLREFAARPGGVHPGELVQQGYKLSSVQQQCRKLVTFGQLFGAGRLTMYRLFSDAAARDRYEAPELALHYAKRKAKRNAASNARQKAKRAAAREGQPPAKPGPKPKLATKSALPGVSIKHYGRGLHRDAPAIIPPGVKPQQCYSPPAFGPAARLLHVSSAQIENRLPALKVGEDR